MASTLPEATAAKPRITWDEHGLATDAKERGVAYGTQKIDHPDTPYLYYDEEEPGHIRAHDSGGAPHCIGGEKVEVDALKRALGLVASAQENGEERFSQPKWAAVDDEGFQARRHDFYAGEAELAALAKRLPPGWSAQFSRSEPREIFYSHEPSGRTQWDMPEGEPEGGEEEP